MTAVPELLPSASDHPAPVVPPVAREPGVLLVVPLRRWMIVLGALGASAVVAALGVRSPVAGVLAVGAVALALYLAQRPILTALVALTLVPITSGLRRDLPVPGFRISELLVVFAAVVVLGLASRAVRGPRWRAWDWGALAYALAFAVYAVLNSAIHRNPLTVDDLQVLAGPIQFFLLYRTVAAAFSTPRLRAIAMRALLLASLPVSLLAILQMVGPAFFQNLAVSVTGTSIFITPGYTPVMRATSLFPMWHPLGGYLLVVQLLAVALLLKRSRNVLATPWLLVVLGLAVVSTIFTLTITIIAGLVLGVLVVGWRVGRLRFVATWMLVGSAVIGVAFFPMIQERIAAQTTATRATPTAGDSVVPQTVQYRIVVWTNEYVPAMQGSWLNGYGTADPPGVAWKHTESGYLTALIRGGVGYLVVSGLVIYLSWRAGRRGQALAREPAEAALAVTVIAVAAVLPVILFFFPYFTASGLPQILWAVWGLLAASLSDRRGAPSSLPAAA